MSVVFSPDLKLSRLPWSFPQALESFLKVSKLDPANPEVYALLHEAVSEARVAAGVAELQLSSDNPDESRGVPIGAGEGYSVVDGSVHPETANIALGRKQSAQTLDPTTTVSSDMTGKQSGREQTVGPKGVHVREDKENPLTGGDPDSEGLRHTSADEREVGVDTVRVEEMLSAAVVETQEGDSSIAHSTSGVDEGALGRKGAMDAISPVGEVLGGSKSSFAADLSVLSGDGNEEVISTMEGAVAVGESVRASAEGGSGDSSVTEGGTGSYSHGEVTNNIDGSSAVSRDGAPKDASSIEGEHESLVREAGADGGNSNDPAGLSSDPHHFATLETTTAQGGSGVTLLSEYDMLKNVGLDEFPHASCAVHEQTEGVQRAIEVAEETGNSEHVHPDVGNIWVKHGDVLGSIGEASGVMSGDAAGDGLEIALEEVPSTLSRGEHGHKIPAAGGLADDEGKDEELIANSVKDEAGVGNISSTLVSDGGGAIGSGGKSNGETSKGKDGAVGGNSNEQISSLVVSEDEDNIEHTPAKSTVGESTAGANGPSSSSAVDGSSVPIVDSNDEAVSGVGAVEGGNDDPTAPTAGSTEAGGKSIGAMADSKGDHVEGVDGISSSSSMLDGSKSAEKIPNGEGRGKAGRGGASVGDGSDGDDQATSAEAEDRDPGSPATTGTAGNQDSDHSAVTSANKTSDRPDDANAKVPDQGEGVAAEGSVSVSLDTGSADGATAKASDVAPTEGVAGQQLGEDPASEIKEGEMVGVRQEAAGNSTTDGGAGSVGATGGGSGGGDGKDAAAAEIVNAAAAGKPKVDIVDEGDVKRARSKVKLGLANLQQGKARKAAALFDKATSLDPGWWEGFYYSALGETI